MRPIYLASLTPYEGVCHLPVITVRFLHPLIDFSQYTGIIFTSKQGIEAFRTYGDTYRLLQCLCVSDATAAHARIMGFEQVFTAFGNGDSIPDWFEQYRPGGKWLYMRPTQVATKWIDTAHSLGYQIDEAIVYETVCNPEVVSTDVKEDGILIFTSPSSVRCYMKLFPLLSTQTVIVLGETTRRSLPEWTDIRVCETPHISEAVLLARQIASEENIS